jgi:hypothetical protein
VITTSPTTVARPVRRICLCSSGDMGTAPLHGPKPTKPPATLGFPHSTIMSATPVETRWPGPRVTRGIHLRLSRPGVPQHHRKLSCERESNRFHVLNSKVGRWSLVRGVVEIGLASLILLHTSGRFAGFVGPAAWAFSFATSVPPLRVWPVGSFAWRVYSGGKNMGVLGWRRLDLSEVALCEESEAGSGQIRFQAIERQSSQLSLLPRLRWMRTLEPSEEKGLFRHGRNLTCK